MKATKTKTALNNRIKRLNEAYRKATPAKRRLMIAKDALKQIKAGQINPLSGTYVRLWTEGVIDEDTNLQPVLLKDNEVTCDCCAKGALFTSCVRLSNRYKGDPTGIGSDGINELVGWPEENYHMIEEAFESSGGDWWYDNYKDDTKRLEAILKNIIRNKPSHLFKIDEAEDYE
jgi:hypothetical protein